MVPTVALETAPVTKKGLLPKLTFPGTHATLLAVKLAVAATI